MNTSASVANANSAAINRKPGPVLRALNALILISIPVMVFITYTDWQIRGQWHQVMIHAGLGILVAGNLFGRFGIWNLYDSPNRRLANIPTMLAVIGMLLCLAGSAVLIKVFIDQDRCLDQGGRWAHKTQICEK